MEECVRDGGEGEAAGGGDGEWIGIGVRVFEFLEKAVVAVWADGIGRRGENDGDGAVASMAEVELWDRYSTVSTVGLAGGERRGRRR